jgi:hypothetical protein
LTECEFNVEFAELIDAFGAVQDFVERPSVLFDHTHPQSAGTGVLHSVWFVSLGGAQRGPGQGGDLYGRFGEQVGLAGEQFDEPLTEGAAGRGGRDDLGQKAFEGGREQLRGTVEMAVEGGAGDLGGFGDRVDGDGFDPTGFEQVGRGVEQSGA